MYRLQLWLLLAICSATLVGCGYSSSTKEENATEKSDVKRGDPKNSPD